MRYSVAHHSLPGTREANEDRVAVAERDGLVLMVVADGLGGYHGGELAADTLTEVMLSSFERARDSAFEDPASFLILSMYFAHTMINKRALEHNIEINWPRTTCVACLVRDGLAYWAHVGDSRLYYVRDNEQLFHTTDHTTATRMLEEGIIDAKGVRSENARLLRCVGGNRRHEVTLGPETQLDTGDTLLLCTDGVWRVLEKRHIE
ncbi:MAG: protein phosphatase 2C domain-containing protein, partial [Saprospiraceae bacterium]|nr:protein phosphatase 2C domain-containing protein [Saprospiraceae bacterium]